MKVFVIAASSVLAILGCQTQGQPSVVYDRSAHVWRSPDGDYAEDRVSGEKVTVATAEVRSYNGITYYFANQDHARRFDADPERYAYPTTPHEQDYPVSR